LDTIAAHLAWATPQSWYDRADFFDAAVTDLENAAVTVGRSVRDLDDAWQRGGPEPVAPQIRAHLTEAARLLREVQPIGIGPMLRRAGDVLASAQAQVRELQQQRAEPGATGPQYDQLARQILHRVTTSYVDIGAGLPNLPATTVLGRPITSTAPDAAPRLVESVVHGGGPSHTALAAAAPLHAVAATPTTGLDKRDPAQSPSAASSGQGMTPFMPMGMGMGMGGGAGPARERDRRSDVYDPDQHPWDTENGWGVPGRNPTPASGAAAAAAEEYLNAMQRRPE
jgi:hypothetical protein